MGQDMLKELEGIVGPENVTDKKFELISYSRDWSYEGPLEPDFVDRCVTWICFCVEFCHHCSAPVVAGPGNLSRGCEPMPPVLCISSIPATRCRCIDTKVLLGGVVFGLLRGERAGGYRGSGYNSPNSRARATASVRL